MLLHVRRKIVYRFILKEKRKNIQKIKLHRSTVGYSRIYDIPTRWKSHGHLRSWDGGFPRNAFHSFNRIGHSIFDGEVPNSKFGRSPSHFLYEDWFTEFNPIKVEKKNNIWNISIPRWEGVSWIPQNKYQRRSEGNMINLWKYCQKKQLQFRNLHILLYIN